MVRAVAVVVSFYVIIVGACLQLPLLASTASMFRVAFDAVVVVAAAAVAVVVIVVVVVLCCGVSFLVRLLRVVGAAPVEVQVFWCAEIRAVDTSAALFGDSRWMAFVVML